MKSDGWTDAYFYKPSRGFLVWSVECVGICKVFDDLNRIRDSYIILLRKLTIKDSICSFFYTCVNQSLLWDHAYYFHREFLWMPFSSVTFWTHDSVIDLWVIYSKKHVRLTLRYCQKLTDKEAPFINGAKWKLLNKLSITIIWTKRQQWET